MIPASAKRQNLSDNYITQPRLNCVLVTTYALYSTSNVASFTPDC